MNPFQDDLALIIESTSPVTTSSTEPTTYFNFKIASKAICWFTTRSIVQSFDRASRANNIDGVNSSSIEYTLNLNREPYFYMVFNVLPSVIFVTISYCSFWIDRNSVTARTALAITTVLLTIQTYKAMYESLLPAISS